MIVKTRTGAHLAISVSLRSFSRSRQKEHVWLGIAFAPGPLLLPGVVRKPWHHPKGAPSLRSITLVPQKILDNTACKTDTKLAVYHRT